MPFLTYWPISRGYGRVVVRVALRWSTGCHGPPHVASRIAVFIWLTSGSALIAYVAHARSTAAGEDRQVQLGEASGVGDELDGDDSPFRDAARKAPTTARWRGVLESATVPPCRIRRRARLASILVAAVLRSTRGAISA